MRGGLAARRMARQSVFSQSRTTSPAPLWRKSSRHKSYLWPTGRGLLCHPANGKGCATVSTTTAVEDFVFTTDQRRSSSRDPQRSPACRESANLRSNMVCKFIGRVARAHARYASAGLFTTRVVAGAITHANAGREYGPDIANRNIPDGRS